MTKYLDMSAEVSGDGIYRYWLARRLSMGERAIVFVGLNPSTADATHDDPTSRKCAGFARHWGYDWLYMVNLYAWRGTDPKRLIAFAKDYSLQAVGPNNQDALKWTTQKADLVVAAWGQNKLCSYAKTLSRLVLALPQTRCLGENQDGTPKHPLYVPYAAELRKLGVSHRSDPA